MTNIEYTPIEELKLPKNFLDAYDTGGFQLKPGTSKKVMLIIARKVTPVSTHGYRKVLRSNWCIEFIWGDKIYQSSIRCRKNEIKNRIIEHLKQEPF